MITLEEIERAYSEYSGEIFSFILRYYYNRDTAEDLLQDVFVRLLRYSLKADVNSLNLLALLYTIARSVCIDEVRRSSHLHMESVDLSILPDKHAGEDDIVIYMKEIMDSMIMDLAEPEKSIILFRRNGLTYKEISGIMKISERTLKRKVKSVIYNIRENLRRRGLCIHNGTDEFDESL